MFSTPNEAFYILKNVEKYQLAHEKSTVYKLLKYYFTRFIGVNNLRIKRSKVLPEVLDI